MGRMPGTAAETTPARREIRSLPALLVNQIAAGEVVTTGTCATPLPVAPGDAVRADFGALGVVSLRFDVS